VTKLEEFGDAANEIHLIIFRDDHNTIKMVGVLTQEGRSVFGGENADDRSVSFRRNDEHNPLYANWPIKESKFLTLPLGATKKEVTVFVQKLLKDQELAGTGPNPIPGLAPILNNDRLTTGDEPNPLPNQIVFRMNGMHEIDNHPERAEGVPFGTADYQQQTDFMNAFSYSLRAPTLFCASSYQCIIWRQTTPDSYSTVTLFARLRGLSTSQPSLTAR
jgi:hypothetical protein